MATERTVILRFPTGETQRVRVVPLGGACFRITAPANGWQEEVDVGVVVEARPDRGGRLVVERIVAPSPFTHWEWTLTEKVLRSPAFTALCKDLEWEGALWSVEPEGRLQIHLPRTSDYPLLRVLNKLLSHHHP